MQLVWRIIVVVVVVAVASFAIAFGMSRYFVSKLDGTGGVTATSTPQLQQYASEDGLMFSYPNTYELSSRTEGTAERQWDVLVLLPKGYVPPQGGEGPPAISVSVFPNPEGTLLDQWVKGDARSNYKLSQSQDLAPTTVDGERALYYQHSGLYEFDAVAVAHNGKIFLFEGSWQGEDDQIRRDFQDIVGTVQFNP